MRKSDLDFWQGMAAHYSKFMRRSAPIYAEICNHIRPHLTRDMNVLELACGTGQLSFPLSPYVRLWEATDASSKMIAEAKKQTGSSGFISRYRMLPGCRMPRKPLTRW